LIATPVLRRRCSLLVQQTVAFSPQRGKIYETFLERKKKTNAAGGCCKNINPKHEFLRKG